MPFAIDAERCRQHSAIAISAIIGWLHAAISYCTPHIDAADFDAEDAITPPIFAMPPLFLRDTSAAIARSRYAAAGDCAHFAATPPMHYAITLRISFRHLRHTPMPLRRRADDAAARLRHADADAAIIFFFPFLSSPPARLEMIAGFTP